MSSRHRKRRQALGTRGRVLRCMDGAARFNQRDSMATILITVINIVAGLLIGASILTGADLATAVKTYGTILTVGDGLVTMIPSLLVSVAGGMVLTRASSSGALDQELGTQLLKGRNTLWIACGVLIALALIPGLPKLAFVLMAAGVALIARRLPATVPQTQGAEAESAPTGKAKTADAGVGEEDPAASRLTS